MTSYGTSGTRATASSHRAVLGAGGSLCLLGAFALAVGDFGLYGSRPAPLFGEAGLALTALGVLALYPVLSREGGSEGALWGRVAAAVVLLSLAGLLWVVVSSGGSPGRLYDTASVLAFRVRPFGTLLFAFALVRADIVFGRALLLFAVCLFETPLIWNLAYDLTGASGGWAALLFGDPTGAPGSLPGIPGALLWGLFGYSLLRLNREISRGFRGRRRA